MAPTGSGRGAGAPPPEAAAGWPEAAGAEAQHGSAPHYASSQAFPTKLAQPMPSVSLGDVFRGEGGAPQLMGGDDVEDVSHAIADALRPVLSVPPLPFHPALQTQAVAAAAAAAAAVAAEDAAASFHNPNDALALGLGGPMAGTMPGINVAQLVSQIDAGAFAPPGEAAGFADPDPLQTVYEPSMPYDDSVLQPGGEEQMPGPTGGPPPGAPLGGEHAVVGAQMPHGGHPSAPTDPAAVAAAATSSRPNQHGHFCVGARRRRAPMGPGMRKRDPRKHRNLPVAAKQALKEWMMAPEHINHPYPSEQVRRRRPAPSSCTGPHPTLPPPPPPPPPRRRRRTH